MKSYLFMVIVFFFAVGCLPAKQTLQDQIDKGEDSVNQKVSNQLCIPGTQKIISCEDDINGITSTLICNEQGTGYISSDDCSVLKQEQTSLTGDETFSDPDFYFSDNFSDEKDSDFWLGDGVYVNYGINDPIVNGNKVMEMRYVPNSEGGGRFMVRVRF